MITVETSTPSPEPPQDPSLADLSRNASVISSSSSGSASSLLLKTPRPRPIRTFSSPRSRSPGGPTTPRASRPPAYLTRELGFAEEPPEFLPHRQSARAQSNSKSRSSSANGRLSAEDFEFGEVLGEGSYSTVRLPLLSTPLFLKKKPSQTQPIGSACHPSRHPTRVRYQSHRQGPPQAQQQAPDRPRGEKHPRPIGLGPSRHRSSALDLSGRLELMCVFPPSGTPPRLPRLIRRPDFVIDLAKNGELQSQISRLGSLATSCARYYAAQMVDALDYMHAKGVIHRFVPALRLSRAVPSDGIPQRSQARKSIIGRCVPD